MRGEGDHIPLGEVLSVQDCWDSFRANDFVIASETFRSEVARVLRCEVSESIRSMDYSLNANECTHCQRTGFVKCPELLRIELCARCKGVGWKFK